MRGRGGRRGQGAEVEEVNLGAGEEGRRFGVGEGRGLELRDDLGEALFRHGCCVCCGRQLVWGVSGVVRRSW